MENNIQLNVQPENYSGNNQITPPHPKTNPLVIISLILLILLISAGSFVLGKYFTGNKTKPSLPPTPLVQQPTVIPTTDPTASWKTYINTKDNYSFKYPDNWNIGIEQSLPTQIYMSHLNKNNNQLWGIRFGLISQDQINTMGITYCEAYPEDKNRCENILLNNINGSIDWGTRDGNTAIVWIPYVNQGIITITLTPVNPETKKILDQILSTFKFLE